MAPVTAAERPVKRRAQRCSACGLVSPGSATHCDCGLPFTGERPAAVVRREKSGWENLGGALFLAIVFAGTSIVLTVLGEWPLARTVFAVGAAIAIAGAVWAVTRIPRDQRTWGAVPKRSATWIVVVSAIVVGGIAYGLHDYLGTTYVTGHDCTSDNQCRSSQCFQARGDSPGVCTELCDDDGDCPTNMICTQGRSVRPGEEITGGGTAVQFCTFGRRAQ
jgi:hypothetical protein